MADSVIDFAGLDTSATVAPVVDSGATDVTTPEVDAGAGADTSTAGGEDSTKVDSETDEGTATHKADGTERTAEERKAFETAAAAKADPTPQSIRTALKALRDANPDDPATSAAVKKLHGHFERWEATKALVPGGFEEIRSQVGLLRELAGITDAKATVTVAQAREGLLNLQQTVDAALESDQQLYAGDKQLVDNVVADLKAQGKLDTALPKLTREMLSSLEKEAPAAFGKVAVPFMVNQLRAAGFVDAVNTLHRLASANGDKAITAKTTALGAWFNQLLDTVEASEQEEVQSEHKSLLDEKKNAETTARTTFKNTVASSCEKVNNRTLGTELAPFLKMPFFKGYGKENLTPLGNAIKSTLYATLKADTAYQTQMKAMWSAKNPDRAKIEEYHKTQIASIAKDIVRNTVQKMYPSYAKGGAAAGRIAAGDAKREADAKATAASKTGSPRPGTTDSAAKPIYVATKPAWETIDWERDPKQMLYITGKSYLKGSGKLVTWRRS